MTQSAYLSPKISGEEVRAMLCRGKKRFPFRLRKTSPPKRVELIYLPFYLFEVVLEGKREERRVCASVDGLLGNATLYAGENIDTLGDTQYPACHPTLSIDEAKRISETFLRGLVLEQGLRVKEHYAVKRLRFLKLIFYPFWIAYFQTGNRYDFTAVDGIVAEILGGKMRKLFLKAFRQMDRSTTCGSPNR